MKIYRTLLITTITILAKTVLLGLALSSTATASIVIAQLNNNFESGNKNYGQMILVDSTLTGISGSVALDSVTFFKAGGSGNVWIDVYDQGTLTDSPDFSKGTGTGDLNYLGSSSAPVDFASASNGEPLEWTFNEVTLPVDTNIYLVLSNDSSSGDWIGRELKIVNNGTQDFTNITNTNSDPLFGGSPNTDVSNDNLYSVVVIPEPSIATVLLGAFAALLVTIRRRNRR